LLFFWQLCCWHSNFLVVAVVAAIDFGAVLKIIGQGYFANQGCFN